MLATIYSNDFKIDPMMVPMLDFLIDSMAEHMDSSGRSLRLSSCDGMVSFSMIDVFYGQLTINQSVNEELHQRLKESESALKMHFSSLYSAGERVQHQFGQDIGWDIPYMVRKNEQEKRLEALRENHNIRAQLNADLSILGEYIGYRTEDISSLEHFDPNNGFCEVIEDCASGIPWDEMKVNDLEAIIYSLIPEAAKKLVQDFFAIDPLGSSLFRYVWLGRDFAPFVEIPDEPPENENYRQFQLKMLTKTIREESEYDGEPIFGLAEKDVLCVCSLTDYPMMDASTANKSFSKEWYPKKNELDDFSGEEKASYISAMFSTKLRDWAQEAADFFGQPIIISELGIKKRPREKK